MNKETDMVNHPKHYEGKFECIEVMEDKYSTEAVIAFCEGNAFKYLWRWNKKNGKEDIAKAKWYISKTMSLKGVRPIKDALEETEIMIDVHGEELTGYHFACSAFNLISNLHTENGFTYAQKLKEAHWYICESDKILNPPKEDIVNKKAGTTDCGYAE